MAVRPVAIKIELCGDGIMDEGEACDDGNVSPIDGCDRCQEMEWQVKTKIAGAEEDTLNHPKSIALDKLGNFL